MTVQHVYVFFSSGAIYNVGHAMVALLSKSHLVHVSYGTDDWIVDRTREKGEFLWERKGFVAYAPCLQVMLTIPVERAFNPMELTLDRRPISVIRGMAHVASGGLLPHANCVSRCRQYLAMCGVDTPDNLLFPINLYEYLRARADAEVVIDTDHPAHHRASRKTRGLATPAVPRLAPA